MMGVIKKMFQLFKLSLLKQFWEIKNNRFRLVFGVFANIFFVVFFYYNIAKKIVQIF